MCNILVVTQEIVHYLICAHSPSGAPHPRVYISRNALFPVLHNLIRLVDLYFVIITLSVKVVFKGLFYG